MTDIKIISEDKAAGLTLESVGLDQLLKEETLRERAKSAKELFNRIQNEFNEMDDIKEGLSFLDLKNDLLLSYMIDVCNIVLIKLRQSNSIEGHQSVNRCVEYRVILEKIKGIDQKLAYQLNQLITRPDQEEEQERIQLENLNIDLDVEEEDDDDDDVNRGRKRLSKEEDDDDDDDDDGDDEDEDDDVSSGGEDGDEDDDDEEEEIQSDDDKTMIKGKQPPQKLAKNTTATKTSGGIYKPPKLRSVAYAGDVEKGIGSRGRRKNYDEFYQDDDQARDIVEESRLRNKNEFERIKFEESNYTRLPDDNPKKAKRKLKTKEYRRKGGNQKKFRKR